MAGSCVPSLLGRAEVGLGRLTPPRTPGPLGLNDQADPRAWSWPGDTPGALGCNDLAGPAPGLLLAEAQDALRVVTTPGPAPPQDDAGPALLEAQHRSDLVLLAAVAYGEASAADVFEEMAAIANVIVRQAGARDTALGALLGPKSTYAFAASDGNARVAAFRKLGPADRLRHPGMRAALEAARNALDGGRDYSNGAYFWDGADLKSNYAHHPKVKRGIKFTSPAHNIYSVRESSVDVTEHWKIKDKAGALVDGAVRGKYTYVYESTAAYGGTVFWKYGAAFLKATGNAPYQ